MKQRITVEQLNELTEGQKENLREWWEPQRGDWAYISTETLGFGSTVLVTNYHPEHKLANLNFISEDGFCSCTKENLLPLLSIGQMVELLGHGLMNIEYDFFINAYYVKAFKGGMFGEVELVTALWRAVKSTV